MMKDCAKAWTVRNGKLINWYKVVMDLDVGDVISENDTDWFRVERIQPGFGNMFHVTVAVVDEFYQGAPVCYSNPLTLTTKGNKVYRVKP